MVFNEKFHNLWFLLRIKMDLQEVGWGGHGLD
jgi:hypothetical protein